jgi:hypothetical protein
MSWSSQWSLSFWISHQYSICIPRLPIRATWPAPPAPLFWIIKLQNCQESHFHKRHRLLWTYEFPGSGRMLRPVL